MSIGLSKHFRLSEDGRTDTPHETRELPELGVEVAPPTPMAATFSPDDMMFLSHLLHGVLRDKMRRAGIEAQNYRITQSRSS